MERLLPSLEPETYRSWAKALAIAPSATSNIKRRTQCTRLPLYAGSGRGECRLALPPFMERLLPSLEPETYRSWAKALAIAPSATSYQTLLIKN
ncbi:hypothetical protein DVH24_029296 [Malus domestica]|uniref:Uncharacterized protein n=1 Tax=Malus domestica TaxID=3750 RepID=A0A498HYC4_MALDO|nr:hypothetical protein DVH24_029296 [Malus domestica]